jgi:hypothetical protein
LINVIAYYDFVKLKLNIMNNFNFKLVGRLFGTMGFGRGKLYRFSPAPPHKTISAKVNQKDDKPQNKLDLRGEAWGIDEGECIMLYESSAVSGVTAGLAEPVFQGGEGAEPSAKLQGRRPQCGW